MIYDLGLWVGPYAAFGIAVIERLLPLLIAGFVGWYWFRKQDLHTLRMGLLADLMANRYHVTGDEFSRALNRALLLFHDDPNVVRALRDFMEKARELGPERDKEDMKHKMISVFRCIARNLGISELSITDADWSLTFNARRDPPVPVNLRVEHRVTGVNEPSIALIASETQLPCAVGVSVLNVQAASALAGELQTFISRNAH